MSEKGYSVFRKIQKEPVNAIVALVAVGFFIFGLYVASPFYVADSSAALSQAFAGNDLQRSIVGFLFFVIPSSPIILGFFKRRFFTPPWTLYSTLGMFVGMLFLTILRWVTLGFFPLTWVFGFILAFVLAICYLHLKARD